MVISPRTAINTTFIDKLYESVGLKGKSQLKLLHPDTGETLESFPMESKYFAEGLTYCKGKLIQLTYKKLKGFVYDARDIRVPLKTFDFKTTTGEGWGVSISVCLSILFDDCYKSKRKSQISHTHTSFIYVRLLFLADI